MTTPPILKLFDSHRNAPADPLLRHNPVDHITVDVGEPPFDAVVVEREAFMVQTR